MPSCLTVLTASRIFGIVARRSQIPMRSHPLLLCVFALAIALGDAAVAQVAVPATGVQTSTGLAGIPPEPHVFGELRLGVLTFAPTLRLSEIGIDTNVFNLEGTERQPPDFTATVQPGLEARVETTRAGLRVLGTGAMVYYNNNDFERSINPAVQLAGFFRVARKIELFGEAGGGYGRAHRGYEIDVRPRTSSKNYAVGARFLSRRVGLEAVAQHGETRYDPAARYLGVQLNETLDRTTQSTNLAVSYRFSPYTTFALGVAAIGDRFPSSPNRDTAANRAYVSAAFHPRALISGSVQVGYVLGKTLSNVTPDFSGVTANAGVSYTWRDAFSVSLGASRDFEFSYRVEHPYYRYDIYEGAIRQALSHRFDIGVGMSLGTLSYPVLGDVPAVPTEVLRQLSGSVGARVTRQVRVGVYVRRIERLTGSRPYQAYRSGLEVTVGKVNFNERGVFLHGVSR